MRYGIFICFLFLLACSERRESLDQVYVYQSQGGSDEAFTKCLSFSSEKGSFRGFSWKSPYQGDSCFYFKITSIPGEAFKNQEEFNFHSLEKTESFSLEKAELLHVGAYKKADESLLAHLPAIDKKIIEGNLKKSIQTFFTDHVFEICEDVKAVAMTYYQRTQAGRAEIDKAWFLVPPFLEDEKNFEEDYGTAFLKLHKSKRDCGHQELDALSPQASGQQRQLVDSVSKKPIIKKWRLFLTSVEEFFYKEGFDYAKTPSLVPCPGTEPHLSFFSTFLEKEGKKQKLYLASSPEMSLKKLFFQGWDQFFEIKTCFRNKEVGRLHSPEFTMLEWYKVGPLEDLIEIKVFVS